jgi:hypothetical protein
MQLEQQRQKGCSCMENAFGEFHYIGWDLHRKVGEQQGAGNASLNIHELLQPQYLFLSPSVRLSVCLRSYTI